MNNDLKKEKIAPLAVLDKETYLKIYDAPASMSKSGLMEALKGVKKD